MPTGLLYDVHANLPALEAVLADAAQRGVDRFVLGGDFTLFGAWPAETLARLRELDAEWIRGNGERWTANPDEAPDAVQAAVAACRELLGEETVAELARLPFSLTKGDTLFCHASPISDVESFLPAASDDDERLLEGVTQPRVVFGHTHIQFRRPGPGGVELVNPGSVGMPVDGDHRAAYAVLGDDGKVQLCRVAYDHAASAAAVRERFGAAGELTARRIERARMRVD